MKKAVRSYERTVNESEIIIIIIIKTPRGTSMTLSPTIWIYDNNIMLIFFLKK